MTTPGEHVRTRREALGLSRVQAEELTGVGRTTWVRVEQGKNATASTLRKIGKALGWSEDSFQRMERGLPPELVQKASDIETFDDLVSRVEALERTVLRLVAEAL